MLRKISFLFFAIPFFLAAREKFLPEEIVLDLKDPIYREGTLYTDQGGVLYAKGIRIQAKTLSYTHKKSEGIHKIVAKGDLLIDLDGRIFVGDELEYDFETATGVVYNGKTAFNLWFFGGERIVLNQDKSFTVYGAYITTSDSPNHEWDIYAKKIHVNKEMTLAASNVQFRVSKFPIFWLPYYKSSLHKIRDTPVKYKITWDKGQGPKFTMRYRIYSNELANLFFRLDFRFFKGPGGALEGDYRSEDKRVFFQSKNYVAHDTFYNDDDPNKVRTRYRIQGLYDSISLSEKSAAHLSWDKISDKNMPGDFPSDDFEVNTSKRTEAIIRHYERKWIGGLNFRPRINSFQGFKQELPTVAFDLKPYTIGKTGAVLSHRVKLAYLDYVYSDDIEGVIPDFSSGRFALANRLCRPFSISGINLIPSIQADGIYYTDSENSDAQTQILFHYQFHSDMPFYRDYPQWTHVVKPYAQFYGLLDPTANFNNVFIFSLLDGYHRINYLKLGLANLLYSKEALNPYPEWNIDVYTLAFFGDSTYSKTFPKAYARLEWTRGNLHLNGIVGWNFQENLLDRANIALAWTISEEHALQIEYLHRSRFDWRKDDYENYYLDVARPISQLVDSPISDGRNALYARVQFKIAPKWILQGQAHFGWGRGSEPGYSEAKIDIITLLNSAWRLKLSYMHTVRDDQFKVNLFMAQY